MVIPHFLSQEFRALERNNTALPENLSEENELQEILIPA